MPLYYFLYIWYTSVRVFLSYFSCIYCLHFRIGSLYMKYHFLFPLRGVLTRLLSNKLLIRWDACAWQTTVKTGLVSFSLNEQIAKSANTDCVKSLLMISSSKPTNGNVHLHRVLINFLPLKNVSWHEVHRLSVSSSFIYRFISALFLIKLTVLLLKTWVNLLLLLTPFKFIGIMKSVRCYCTSMFSRILGSIMKHVQSSPP